MARKRPLVVAAAAALALVVVAAALLWLRERPLRGAFEPGEVTRVAVAARPAVVPVSDGVSTRVAVVAVPGVALAGAGPPATATPTAVATPLVGEGTPAPDVMAEETPTASVLTDPRGLSAVRIEGATAPVPLGRSDDLAAGDELLLVAGEVEPIVLRFVGRAQLPIGTSVIRQTVLDLQLPDGAAFRAGPLLDRRGRLVGVVVPERQAGAPPGRLYAVPVEQAGDLLRRAGAVNSAP